MAEYLKQIGTEDSKIILSVSDSAKSLYEKCKEISKLIVNYYNGGVIDQPDEDHSKLEKLKQYADEFSELFGSLIGPFILEQRLSILDSAHPLKEENPVHIGCRTLGIEGLKVKDTMDVLHEGISIVEHTLPE